MSTVKGVARINAIRIDQHDNITGLDLALAIEGKSLEVAIDVPGDGQARIRRRVSLQAGETVTVVAAP